MRATRTITLGSSQWTASFLTGCCCAELTPTRSLSTIDGPRSEERLLGIRSSLCCVSGSDSDLVARKLWITNIKAFSTIA